MRGAQDITVDPSFMGLYRDCLRVLMPLKRHIIGYSRVLKTMRDAGQHHDAMTNTSDEVGGDDDEGINHDAFGSTNPSDHGL